MSCTCQRCHNLYDYDLSVPDDVWEEIKPEGKPKGAGLLCPDCIAKAILTRLEKAEATAKILAERVSILTDCEDCPIKQKCSRDGHDCISPPSPCRAG